MNILKKTKSNWKVLAAFLMMITVLTSCICYYVMPEKMKIETDSYVLEEQNAIREEVTDYLIKYVTSDGFVEQISESEDLQKKLAQMIKSGEVVLLNEEQIDSIAQYAAHNYEALLGSNIDTLTDEQIKDLEESIREKITITIEDAAQREEDVNTMTGGVSSIVIKNILAQLEEMNASIEKLQDELNTIKDNIAIGASFSDISSSIGKLEERLEYVKDNLAEEDKALANDIEEISEDLKTLHVNIDETATVVVQLETTMDELTKKSLDSLNIQVGDTTSAIDKILKDYESILEKINNLQNNMTSKDSQLTTIINETSNKIADVSDLIKALQKELSDYKSSMDKTIKNVQATQTALDKNISSYKNTTDKSLSNLQTGQETTNKNLSDYKNNTNASLTDLSRNQETTNKNLSDYKSDTNASLTELSNGQNALNKNLSDYQDITNADITNIYSIISSLQTGQETNDVDLTEIKNKLNELDEKLQQCFSSVSSGKASLASALTDKGISTDATAAFAVLTENVKSIGKDANVIANAMLSGYTAYVGNTYVTGNMKANTATETKLNCGESYSIASGYHTGAGKVISNTLASQTPADAAAGNLSKGKTGWVNGRLITGTGADTAEAYNDGYADGIEDAIDGANISYTYHTHSGDTLNGGGCYNQPVYHVHSDSCYGKEKCGCSNYVQGESLGEHFIHGEMWNCKNCRHDNLAHYSGSCTYENTVLKCGKTTSTIEGYALGCGKTENTIESAVIIFN